MNCKTKYFMNYLKLDEILRQDYIMILSNEFIRMEFEVYGV